MGAFNNKKDRKKENRKRLNSEWIRLVGGVIIIVGLVFVIGAQLSISLIAGRFGDVINSILMPLGQVLLSIGVTARVFEHFGYADYTTERVCEALASEEVLNVLNEQRKIELKDMLFEDIYLGRQPEKAPQELVHQIEGDMEALLADYYYDEYHTFCDISLFEDKNGRRFIKKKIHRTIMIKPIRAGKRCKVDGLFYSRTNKIDAVGDDGETLAPVKFDSLYIDDVKMKEGIDFRLHSDECDHINYPRLYTIQMLRNGKAAEDALVLEKAEMRVRMDYTTYVSCEDLMYSVTVRKPCKSFFCSFNCNIPEHILRVKSYGFMSFGRNTPDKNARRIDVRTETGVTVRFRSWLLPGDGAIIMIEPGKNRTGGGGKSASDGYEALNPAGQS